MESYHNTNNEQGTLLFESNKKANSQEEKILKIFRTYPNKVFSAEKILSILNLNNIPLTSIRRAISNLSNPIKWNMLEKTDIMINGQYGKQVYTWRLK